MMVTDLIAASLALGLEQVPYWNSSNSSKYFSCDPFKVSK